VDFDSAESAYDGRRLPDRLRQRLRSADDEEAADDRIEAVADENIEERLHRRGIVGRVFNDGRECLLPSSIPTGPRASTPLGCAGRRSGSQAGWAATDRTTSIRPSAPPTVRRSDSIPPISTDCRRTCWHVDARQTTVCQAASTVAVASRLLHGVAFLCGFVTRAYRLKVSNAAPPFKGSRDIPDISVTTFIWTIAKFVV
jgi:hypothetical protein